MQKAFFLVTVLASTLTLAAATVARAQSDPAALLKQYMEAINRGDAAGALAMFADDAVYEHSGALCRRLPPGLTRTTTHANSYFQKLFTNSYTSRFSNVWIILSDASKCFVSAFSLYEKLFEPL